MSATITPHPAPSSPSPNPVPPVPRPAPLHNPLAWLAWWFTYLTLAGLLLPLLLFPISKPLALGCVLFGLPFTLAMGISALCTAIYTRTISRRLRRFQEGEYLVRWQYMPGEWKTFAQAEADRVRGLARWAPLHGLAIGALPGLILGGCIGNTFLHGAAGLVGLGLLGGLVAGGLGAAIGWLVRALIRGGAERTRRRILGSAPQAYIGEDAAYCGGMYISWRAFRTWLADVQVLPGDPATLEFTVHTQVRQGHAEHRVRIPLPYARHAEAVWLINYLSGAVRR